MAKTKAIRALAASQRGPRKGGGRYSSKGVPAQRDEDADSPPGRPVALSAEGREALLKAIARGGSREDAARFASIATSTLYRYLQDGRAERREARRRDPDAAPPPCSRWELLEAIKIAESQFRLGCLDGINAAAEAGTWQAYAWLLERKYPGMFGRVARVDVGGAGSKSPGGKGEPVQIKGGGVVVLPQLDDA